MRLCGLFLHHLLNDKQFKTKNFDGNNYALLFFKIKKKIVITHLLAILIRFYRNWFLKGDERKDF